MAKKSRYADIQRVRASGGKVPFFPLAEAKYLCLLKRCGFRDSRSTFYYVHVIILDAEVTKGEGASVGETYNVQFNEAAMGKEFAMQKAKEVGLVMLSMSEKEFDSLPPKEAIAFFDILFAEDETPYTIANQSDPILMRARTWPDVSKDNKKDITQLVWDPIDDEEREALYEEYGEVIAEYWVAPEGDDDEDE